MKVLKFGGSSVGTPERIKVVKQIAEGEPGPVLIVVSALHGITDQLEKLAVAAASKEAKYKDILKDIRQRHNDFIDALTTKTEKSTVLSTVNTYLNELEEVISGVYLLNDLTPRIHDRILSYGELISSYILSSLFQDAKLIDSREVIRTDNNYRNARVNFAQTNSLIAKKFKDVKATIFVAPGFIASSEDEHTTTLGRGWSFAAFVSLLSEQALRRRGTTSAMLVSLPLARMHSRPIATPLTLHPEQFPAMLTHGATEAISNCDRRRPMPIAARRA